MNNNNNLYNILNNFNKLSESDTPQPAAESKPKTLLESTMEEVLQEKYMGFKKTVGALKKQGGIENPEALAASIGRKKYGKKAFQKAAAAGKKMGEEVVPPKTYGGQGPEGQKFDIYMQNRKDAVDKQRPAPPVPVVKPMGEGEGPHDWMQDMKALAHKMHPQDKLKQAHADRMSQQKAEHQARIEKDRAMLPELEAEYQAMQAEYKQLGGSNHQYADREQNLSDREHQARNMEGALRQLANRIHAAKQGVVEGELETGYMNKQHQDFYNKNPNFKRDDREVKSVGDRLASKVTPTNKPAQVTKKPITKFEEDSDWSNLGAEYRSTKPGTKEPTHTGEKEYFKGGVRHTKDFNREVGHTAATGEKRGRGRPKKSQFESHNTIDRLIAEAFGDDDNKEQSLNYEQDQLRNSIGDDLFAELQRLISNGDYDFSDDLFQALYDHYFDEMPQGTRKARDGDPYEWIGDRIGEVFADESLEEGNWQDIDDRSAPVKGANQKIKTIEPGSAIRVDPNYKDPTTNTVPKDNGMGRIVQGTWQADPKGTVKAPSGDPEGVKEADADPFADDPFFNTKSQPEPVIRAQQKSDLAQGKGTSLKDMHPLERDQYLQSTGRTWDEKTQRSVPAQVQQKEDIMMTNELAEMMRLAGMTEGKKAKPDYLDFDKDGDKKEPMKSALKDKKVDEAEEKADKDYDGDGEVETGKEEYLGSKIAAAKKAGKLKEGTCKSCHKDPCVCKEEKCMECGMYESKCKCDANLEEALNQMRRIAGLKECDMSPVATGAGDMQQQQGKMNISTNMSSDGNKSVTITADGDSALELMQMLKLAGMGGGEEMHHQEPEGVMVVAQDAGDEHHEEEVDETKDPRYHANTTPEEHVYPEQVLTKGGDGDVAGREKKMHKDGYQFGDNPMAMKESMGLKFMKEYEGIKVKK